MWDSFSPDPAAFAIEKGQEEILNDARQEFEKKIQSSGRWGRLENVDDNDELDMSSVEDIRDEEELDEVLAEVLCNIGQSTLTSST